MCTYVGFVELFCVRQTKDFVQLLTTGYAAMEEKGLGILPKSDQLETNREHRPLSLC